MPMVATVLSRCGASEVLAGLLMVDPNASARESTKISVAKRVREHQMLGYYVDIYDMYLRNEPVSPA